MLSNTFGARYPGAYRRDRRDFLRSLFVPAAVCALLLVCGGCRGPGVSPENSAAENPPVEALTATEPSCTLLSYTHSIKQGETFASIFNRYGLPEQTATLCFREFRKAGLTAIYPGDSLNVVLDSTGALQTVSLLNRLQYWYHATCTVDTLSASREAVETIIRVCSVKGTLLSSLSQDLWTLGETDALVAQYTDVFAWDINFFTDPRVGDEFEILFEKKYAAGRFTGYGTILAARYFAQNRTYAAFAVRDDSGRLQYFDVDGNSVQKQFLKAPLRYSRISSGFSYRRRHPILGIYRPHMGVDYAAPRGTPVYAAADGVVAKSGWNGDYGRQVTIRHGAAWVTMYGHLQSIASGVSAGSRISQGQLIGTVGSTGLSSGPHLDYRMSANGRFVNPLTVDLPSGDPVGDSQREVFERGRDIALLMLGSRVRGRAGSYVLWIETPTQEPLRVVSAPKKGRSDAGTAGS